MSKDFGTFPQRPFEGRPYSMPIALCVPMRVEKAIGARAVRVDIDWLAYGVGTMVPRMGVALSLIAQQTTLPLDAIRSVYIDNSFSDFPIFVQFADTKYTVVCPPQAVAILPVVTGVYDCIVYSEGFFDGVIPQTTLQFMNIEVDGMIAETLYNDPVVMRLNNGIASGNFTGASVVIPAVRLGPVEPNRYMAIALNTYDDTSGASLVVNSATLGGVAMTAIAQDQISGPIAAVNSSIWFAPVSAVLGQTAPLVLQFSRSVTGQVWGTSQTLTNITSGAIASTTVASNDRAILTSSMRVVPGAAQIYIGSARGALNTPEFLWYNIEPTNYNFYPAGGGANTVLLAGAVKIADKTGFDNVSGNLQVMAGASFI